jgi:hypothetical protein
VERAVVCRSASLGHDVVAMVRDVQAASRGLPSGVAPLVANYEDASALKRALAGIDDMVLISRDGDASAVMRHHANAIESATAANITFTGIVDPVELSPFYFSPNEIFRPSLSEPRPALDGADVGEHVVAAVIRLCEAEALCRVEPLNCSGSHFNFSRMRKCAVPARPSRELNPISAMSWGVEPVRRDQQGKRLFEWEAPLCLR